MGFLDPNTPLGNMMKILPMNRKSTDIRQAYKLLSHDVVSQLSRIFGTGFCGGHYQTSH